MAKDLFTRPYGRFYYLANYLAECGHNVQLVLMSYRKNENQSRKEKYLNIKSISLLPNPVHALFTAYHEAKESNADWIFGFSDTYYGIMAAYFARLLKKKSLVDAYDNYEAYISFAKPLHWIWRSAIRKADLVTCAGPGLGDLFRQAGRTGRIEIVPMTADPTGFSPMSKQESRRSLELPVEKKLVGYHGSIHHSRDINVLFDAVRELKENGSDITLVLSGRYSRNVNLPDDVLYLGYLADEKMPCFINSMDVIAVPNRRSVFGEHSYPIKIYEAMACKVPVVATKTRATEWILKHHPELLVPANTPKSFAEAIIKVIDMDKVEYEPIPTWNNLAEQLNSYITGSI